MRRRLCRIKDRRRLPPVFKMFYPSAKTILCTVASGSGLGVVLSQLDCGIERPVMYLSRHLSDAKAKYHSNELECLALVWAL